MNSLFKIDKDGRKKLTDAVKALGVYKGFSEALWFGFGINNPLRSLASSEEGMILCGVCGALGECYGVENSADILQGMVVLTKAPEHIMPSLLQWQDLVKTCSGFLARTSFPKTLDGFIRLTDIPGRKLRGEPSPIDMADVLHGLASVTRGEIHSITVKGGVHVGFLAAVAEWLFSLTVCITRSDGQLLYCKSTSPQTIQVNIICTDFATADPKSLERVANTYILAGPSDIFKGLPAHISGRVPWDEALSLTFGHDFQSLLDPKLADHVAIVLGSALAAINLTKTLENPDITEAIFRNDYYKPRQFYPISVSAQDLVSFMCNCFPELDGLKQSAMMAAMGTELTLVLESWNKSFEVIEKACTCRSELPYGIDCVTKGGMYCLCGLVFTMLRLTVSLFNVDSPPDLYPLRSGLLWIYSICGGKSCPKPQASSSPKSSDVGSQTTRQLFRCFGRLNDNRYLIANERKPWNQALLFEDALRIFATDYATPLTDVSAQCAYGICVWNTMLGGTTGQDAVFGRIKVIPGQIEYHMRPYTAIEDRTLRRPNDDQDMSRLTEYNHDILLMQEQIGSLRVTFAFGTSNLRPVSSLEHKMDLRFHIAPVELVGFLEKGRGLVYCDGWSCKGERATYEMDTSNTLSGASKYLLELKVKVTNDKKQETDQVYRVTVIFGSIETRAAFASTVDEGASRWLWRENECFDCCLRALVRLIECTDVHTLRFIKNLFLFSPNAPQTPHYLESKEGLELEQ
ncbi:hypothetical protein AA313_de0207092 [Arthrobotrys entomopaga]|nr:hypothetical protein AA313_de0207092 [Arthrobotrys entomopaga]